MRKVLAVAITLLFLTGLTSPARAGCCDDVLSCAATVVTDGLSCAVQQLISTVTNLINMLRNVGNMLTGTTGSAISNARQGVDETIDAIAQQSQSNAAALAAAEKKASQLASDEMMFHAAGATRLAHPGGSGAASAHAKPSGPASAQIAVHNAGGATALAAPQGTYRDLFERALNQIRQAKAEGDQDFPKINPYLVAARQSEGAGVQSAADIANRAILAPVNQWLDALDSMVKNPLHIFDPSSAVNDMTSSVMSNLDVNLNQMVDSITSGPNTQFQALAPISGHLQTMATEAENISVAMDTVYRLRTPTAAETLAKLLPNASASGLYRASATTTPNAGLGQIMSSFSAKRQASLAAPKRQFQQIAAAMAQLKNLRAQMLSTRASLTNYKANFAQKLNGYFTGKTPAELTAQREALIAQARSRFANDPKTRDAVINLLNSEIAARPMMMQRR